MAAINSADVWRVCNKLGWKYPLSVRRTSKGLVCRWAADKSFVQAFQHPDVPYDLAVAAAKEVISVIQVNERFDLSLTPEDDLLISQ